MKLNKILLLVLIFIGIAMIFLGVKAGIKPPILTGVGFFIIAYLVGKNDKK